jgi:putative FmdB family regulatory protein
MPIYEYQCTQCGEKFEVRQAMSEDGSKLNCPKCRAGNPQKIFSTFFSPGSSESFDMGSCPTGTCGLPPM